MKPLLPLTVSFCVLAGLVAVKYMTQGTVGSLADEAGLVALQTKPFAESDVAKIEVTAPGGSAPAYTLTREGTSWRVVSSFTAPAAGANVTKLADALAKSEGELRTEDAAVLEQFDLSDARAVVVRALDASGAPLAHLAIGRSSGQRGAFVRNLAGGGTRTFVAAGDLRGLLGLPATSSAASGALPEPAKPDAGFFHGKEFPQLKLDKPKAVEFVTPGRTVAFAKTKKDEKDAAAAWTLTAGGLDASVKQDTLDKAVTSLAGGLAVTALVDPAKKKELGFDSPAYRIAVTTEDGAVRAAVGQTDATCTHFYVRLDATEALEVLYETSEYAFRQMFPTGANLFDLAKFDLSKDAPTHVVVERAGRETIDLSRKGTKPTDDWTLAAPAWPLTAKQSALRGIGSAISSLRLLDYVDPPAAAPAADLVVRFGATGGEMKTVTVGGKAPAGKDRLAEIGGLWFVVPDNAIERLAPEPIACFETKLLHGWHDDDLTAARIGAGGALALLKDGDAWVVEEGGTKTPAVAEAVEAWTERLMALEVTGVLPGEAGFRSVPLSLERSDGAPLEFGASVTTDGKRVVVLGGAIFTVNDAADLVPTKASLTTAPTTAEPPK